MFGSIGGPELLLIFVLALLLFGPRKLPEIGRTIGKTLAEFKRATNEFRTSLEREVELEKIREVKAELKDPLQISAADLSSAAAPVPYAGYLAGQPPQEVGTLGSVAPARNDVAAGTGEDSDTDAGSSGGDVRRSE